MTYDTDKAIVLVVDDVEVNRQMLSRRLERRGYTPVELSSGIETLDWCRKNHADIILLDWMMPGMSGLEVLRQLRIDPRTQSIPVLMVTARAGTADLVEALEAGANDFVTKPIDMTVLTARMTVHLERAQALNRLSNMNDRLEQEVARRTVELTSVNERLNAEIEVRQKTNEQLAVALERAEESSRAKSAFLANMSHELRTPLNSIIGFSDLLLSHPAFAANPEKVAEYCQHIHRSGSHLLAIINDILDLAKLEAQKMVVRDQMADLGDILLEAVGVCEGQAKQNNIGFSLSRAAEALPVKLDPLMVKRAIINILSNSIKFSPEGSTVRARSFTRNGCALLTISDSGVGMTQAELEMAMTPFVQVDSAMDKRFEGTGLGLPLAHALTTLNNGSLTLESDPGKGTRVTFSFPCAQA